MKQIWLIKKDVVDYLNNRSDFEGWSLSVVNLQSFLRRQSSQKRSRQRSQKHSLPRRRLLSCRLAGSKGLIRIPASSDLGSYNMRHGFFRTGTVDSTWWAGWNPVVSPLPNSWWFVMAILRIYYYNRGTGQSSWTIPTAWQAFNEGLVSELRVENGMFSRAISEPFKYHQLCIALLNVNPQSQQHHGILDRKKDIQISIKRMV